MIAKKIKLVVLDVDGTLTDGKVYIDNNGVEIKAFNVKDGLAIAQAIKFSLDIVIITGRISKVVEVRARELGITELHQEVHNKLVKLIEIVNARDLEMEEVCYIGDDLNDISVMKIVGLPACPYDAAKPVQDVAKYVSQKNGGEGAVREVLEYILKEKNIWQKIVESYEYDVQ
ncbi:KdsC family phosphatase [Candidatus Contubernalis alkaliaceticus]|uniref:KdsC family phosphatase n=1 Tax=Candidatus Contubernalis alkaliaceticus TaxID=338645 RepID=UPI001F4C1D1F|nr:HAD-IIIA family hydrolase [Candidatus Contubernalis alkalaceticus]UNC93553.1 HAD-IIIA family hydrolase [Candidatus Contubernalis alkalaceticus]